PRTTRSPFIRTTCRFFIFVAHHVKLRKSSEDLGSGVPSRPLSTPPMPNKHPRLSRVATTLGLAFALPQAGSAAISVYVSPPDIESAEDSGFSGVSILTENFNHLTPGAAGTFPGASP